MLYNRFTKKEPYVLHCPTDAKILLDCRKKLYSGEFNFTKPDNLEIITFNNKEKPCFLEECMDKVGLNYHVLGKGLEWQNKLKLNLICDFLEKCENKYILSVDGYDAIIIKDLVDIIDKFRNTGKELIFNSSHICWPKVPIKFKCDNLYEAGLNTSTYLNAGVWIGSRDFCLEFFRAAKDQSHSYKDIDYSEQILVKLAGDKFSDYSVDTESEFFQLCHASLVSKLDAVRFKNE